MSHVPNPRRRRRRADPVAAPGVMQFVMAINMHRADPEIADKVAQLQGKFMPTFQMPPPPGAQ